MGISNLLFPCFQMQVKVHLSFPSKFAGPLIGKQASNLAHIKKFSGASKIHVFPKDREAPERYIEIIGTPLQQYFVSIINFVALAPFSTPLKITQFFLLTKLLLEATERSWKQRKRITKVKMPWSLNKFFQLIL